MRDLRDSEAVYRGFHPSGELNASDCLQESISSVLQWAPSAWLGNHRDEGELICMNSRVNAMVVLPLCLLANTSLEARAPAVHNYVITEPGVDI